MSDFHLLHIVRNAEPDIAGIANLAEAMTADLPIRRSMLFLSAPGPMSAPGRLGTMAPFTVPWRNSRDLAGHLAVFHLLRRLKPDLIHQHAGGWPIRLIARLATRAPIILHLHGRDFPESAPGGRRIQSTIAADAVVAVSAAIASDSREPKCIVIANGVAPPSDLMRKPEPGLIVSAGRFVPIRGFDLLIRALALLPDLRLELAGAGPEQAALEALTASLGISNRVRFLGWMDDLMPLFGRGAIYVSPAREEGFGLALAEAMSAAMPVVATDVGGVSMVVGNAGVLVPPDRSDLLAAAIADLMADPARRAELGAQARERIIAQYSIARMQAETKALYRRILLSRGSAAPWLDES